jgi:hypothetical protein
MSHPQPNVYDQSAKPLKWIRCSQHTKAQVPVGERWRHQILNAIDQFQCCSAYKIMATNASVRCDMIFVPDRLCVCHHSHR